MMTLMERLVELEGERSFEFIDIEAFILLCGYAPTAHEDPDLRLYVHPCWRGSVRRLVFVRSHRFIPTGYVREILAGIRSQLETGSSHVEGG